MLLVEKYTANGLLVVRGPDAKNDYWVRLCVGHPYANRYGWARLHRYLMARKLGRQLQWYEHVHHAEGAPGWTTDVRHLEILEEIDHAHYHYGKRVRCGDHRHADGKFKRTAG